MADLLDGMNNLLSYDNGYLFRRSRITDVNPQKKSIQLSFREGESALIFQRILGGQDMERRGHFMGNAVHGNLPLLHSLQQGGLDLGGGAVDFVRQNHLGNDRSGVKLEIARFLIINSDAGNIAREHIGRELNAFEAAG